MVAAHAIARPRGVDGSPVHASNRRGMAVMRPSAARVGGMAAPPHMASQCRDARASGEAADLTEACITERKQLFDTHGAYAIIAAIQ